MVFKSFKELNLDGYVDPIPEKPTLVLKNIGNKSFQSWFEKFFNNHVGFRAVIIRSINSVHFKLFHEMHNPFLNIFYDSQRGLVSNLAVDAWNYEARHSNEMRVKYLQEAKRIARVSAILAHEGKFFVFVEASSKAYIYPKSFQPKFLDVYDEASYKSFIQALKKAGVNYIDTRALLKQDEIKHHREMFSFGGLHWNFYSGFLVAKAIFEKGRNSGFNLPDLFCKQFDILTQLYHVDNDGLVLLNLLNPLNFLHASIFPNQVYMKAKNFKPLKIVYIGDSFSEQIKYSLKTSKVYSQIIMSDYFKTRHIETEDPHLIQEFNSKQTDDLQKLLMSDIKNSDMVILEAVDYNLATNLSYGFTEYFLQNYK